MDELVRKNRELDGLVQYLRSVVESKDGRIADLEAQVANVNQQKQVQMSELKNQNAAFVTELQTQITSLLEQNKKISSDLELAESARSENLMLKQQLTELTAELHSGRIKHQEEIMRTRQQVTLTRASLASEFNTQLEQALEQKIKETIESLPIQARAALGEKEVLRVQLHRQNDEIQELVDKMNAQKRKTSEMNIEMQQTNEMKDSLAKANQKLKMEAKKQQAKMEEMDHHIRTLEEKAEELRSARENLKKLLDENIRLSTENEKLAKQRAGLERGLERAAQRLGMELQCFYVDPFTVTKTRMELPSILKDKGRFIVPEM